MKFLRRVRLAIVRACLCALWVSPVIAQQQAPAGAPPQQQPAPANAPQQQPAPAPAAPQQQPTPARPASPFETIPSSPETQPPAATPQQRPQLEAPPVGAQPAAVPNGEAIEAVEFRGAKRVPQDTLKALIV